MSGDDVVRGELDGPVAWLTIDRDEAGTGSRDGFRRFAGDAPLTVRAATCMVHRAFTTPGAFAEGRPSRWSGR